jgi:hypothetical protein
MVIGAEIGNRPDVSILVGNLSGAGSSGLVSDVVDAVVLIGFAIGIDHGAIVSLS